eukprot:scaffold440110_cov20-Prasinocladus_malaysianus.AAC.1
MTSTTQRPRLRDHALWPLRHGPGAGKPATYTLAIRALCRQYANQGIQSPRVECGPSRVTLKRYSMVTGFRVFKTLNYRTEDLAVRVLTVAMQVAVRLDSRGLADLKIWRCDFEHSDTVMFRLVATTLLARGPLVMRVFLSLCNPTYSRVRVATSPVSATVPTVALPYSYCVGGPHQHASLVYLSYSVQHHSLQLVLNANVRGTMESVPARRSGGVTAVKPLCQPSSATICYGLR